MKETKTVKVDSYKNEATDQLVSQATKEVSSRSFHAGKRDAEANLPKLKGDKLLNYLVPILSYIQGVLDQLRKLHSADESIDLNTAKLTDQRQEQINQRDQKNIEKEQAEQKYKELKGDQSITLIIIILSGILGFSISEGLLSQLAIQSILGSYWLSLYSSVVLGIGFAFLAHLFLTKWGIQDNKKLLRRGMLLLFFTSCFTAISVLRSYALNSGMASISQEAQPFMEYVEVSQVLLHLFLMWMVFLISVIISQFAPGFDDLQNLFKAKSEKSKLQKIKKEINAIQEEIKQLDEDLADLKQYSYSRDKAAERDEQQILNLIPSVLSSYVSSNNKHRKGQESPDCFEQEDLHYPITTYFQNRVAEGGTSFMPQSKSRPLFPKIVLLLLSILALSSCRRTPPVPILDLVVFNDNTSEESQSVSYGEVREFMEIDEYFWYSYNIKNIELTDLSHGLSSETHLPMGNESNELLSQRKLLVRNFLLKTEQIFTSRQSNDNKDQSYLYKPIVTEINRLANESRATNRWVVINSDMIEHNPGLSFYNPETQKQLYTNPKAITEQFEKISPIEKDLSGLTIFIVHHANSKDNELFSKIAQLWQFMLTDKGAKCLISAGNINPQFQQP